MMRRRRRTTLLGTLVVLALTSSAIAEGAWVLWSKGSADGRLSESDWTKGGSGGEVFPTYSDCRARITRITHVVGKGSMTDWLEWLMSKGPYDPKRIPPGDKDFIGSYHITGGVASTSGTYYTEWKCLPETMDPRGPKGPR